MRTGALTSEVDVDCGSARQGGTCTRDVTSSHTVDSRALSSIRGPAVQAGRGRSGASAAVLPIRLLMLMLRWLVLGLWGLESDSQLCWSQLLFSLENRLHVRVLCISVSKFSRAGCPPGQSR